MTLFVSFSTTITPLLVMLLEKKKRSVFVWLLNILRSHYGTHIANICSFISAAFWFNIMSHHNGITIATHSLPFLCHSCFLQKVKLDTCGLICKMGKHTEGITASSNPLTFLGPSPVSPCFFTHLPFSIQLSEKKNTKLFILQHSQNPFNTSHLFIFHRCFFQLN